MSKGKYKRKREHSRQKAEQEGNEVRLPHSEVIPAEQQPETAHHPVPIVLNDPKSRKINAWQVAVPISNDGSTQTRQGLVFFNRHATADSLADDFEFPDYGASPGAPLVTGPFTLGSHQVTHTRLMNVPIEHVKNVQDHKGHFYLYGWAHYRDVFPRTPTHLTEFCFELSTVVGDLLKVGGLQEVEWIRCTSSKGKPLHNCFDTECSDYEDAIKK